jgi:hypothetical protein
MSRQSPIQLTVIMRLQRPSFSCRTFVPGGGIALVPLPEDGYSRFPSKFLTYQSMDYELLYKFCDRTGNYHIFPIQVQHSQAALRLIGLSRYAFGTAACPTDGLWRRTVFLYPYCPAP